MPLPEMQQAIVHKPVKHGHGLGGFIGAVLFEKLKALGTFGELGEYTGFYGVEIALDLLNFRALKIKILSNSIQG